MKKIFAILIILLNSLVTYSGQTEKLNQLFQDFEKNGGVTSINIKKPMFKLLNTIDVDDEYLKKIKPILNQVDGLKLLIIPKATFPEDLKSENIENIKLNQEKTNKINKALQGLNFNELMSMNSDGTSMKFLAETEKGDFLENLVFNIDSEDENLVFILNGKMKMTDVNKIINSVETKTATNTVTNTTTRFASENTSSYLNGEARNVGEFSGIDVSMGVNVVFKQESPTNIKVIADADKLQYIITKVENGVLKVYVDNKGVKNLKFKNLSVNVSSPNMSNIKISSGATFTGVNMIKENNLGINTSSGALVKGNFSISNTTNVEASSGSNIKSNITTKVINVNVSSGASANLGGEAQSATIDLNSGASCSADNLKINTAVAKSTSGASLSLSVSNKLKISVSSGGAAKLKGDPELDAKIDKVSGGSFKQIK